VSTAASASSADIIGFWFHEIEPRQWWTKDPAFDAMLRARFEELYRAVARAELVGWRTSAHGRLAEVIVLDQFPRNMYRDTAQAFASDALALALSQEAVACGADRELDVPQRAFLYMPYMHSESLAVHEQALALFGQPGLEYNFDYELQHRRIIERFGRYPHRNAVLGRASTPAEMEFLASSGASF
jgi:uncharacterized protein (DUF924 family)